MPLSRKITAIATPVSTLDADIAGAIAAIAEPPHIAVPELSRTASLRSMPNTLPSAEPIASVAEIEISVTHREAKPTFSTASKRIPKPSKITESCKSFFDAAEVSFCAGLPTVSAIARPSASPTAGFGVITESAAAAANQKYLFPAVRSRKVPFVSIALFPQGFSYYAGL